MNYSEKGRQIIAANCKKVASRLMAFEAESKDLKEKVASFEQKVAGLEKDAEAMKLAMQLALSENDRREVEEKYASIRDKDLNVVKEAMNLGILSSDKSASLGDLCNAPGTDPERMFFKILTGN